MPRPSAYPGKACPREGEGGYRFSDKDMRNAKRAYSATAIASIVVAGPRKDNYAQDNNYAQES